MIYRVRRRMKKTGTGRILRFFVIESFERSDPKWKEINAVASESEADRFLRWIGAPEEAVRKEWKE